MKCEDENKEAVKSKGKKGGRTNPWTVYLLQVLSLYYSSQRLFTMVQMAR